MSVEKPRAAGRWRRADELFHAVLDLPPAERAEALRRLEPDESLHAEVLELLDAHGRAAAFLEVPAIELWPDLALDRSESLEGRRLGRHRLVRRLGGGGMGVVYEAEQDQPRRRVAVKVLRGPIDDRQQRMFEREAEILARLRHPSIADVYEAGTSADGLSYFAMELVEGLPLDEYARGAGLEQRERLELFLQVCAAVGHAHRHGVVHRDLKPANVLVGTPDGERAPPSVKVMDFGLARLVEGTPTSASLVSVGALLGTLPYMSPEQARGTGWIDARSDVYSMGVILYELLTGRLPLSFEGQGLVQAARILEEETPPRPSELDPALRGDLEAILLQALSKEPESRYESVAALAADVRRFLEGAPVLARLPSRAYWVRKALQQNRALAWSSAAVLAVVVAAAATAFVLLARTRAAERRMQAEAARADAALDVLVSSVAAVHPWVAMGEEPTVRDLLDSVARGLAHDGGPPPDLEAVLRTALASAYEGLGRFAEAESHARRACELLGTEGADPVDAAEALALLGGILVHRGELEEGRRSLESALASLRQHGAAPEKTAGAELALAACLRFAGDAEGAEELYRTILDRGPDGPPDDVRLQCMRELGGLLSHQGRSEEAERLLLASLADERARRSTSDPELATAVNNLAAFYHQSGRLDEAEPLYREAGEVLKKTLPPDHPLLGAVANNHGDLLRRMGEDERAAELLREALDLRRTALGDDHALVASTRNNLGLVLTDLGRFDEAEEHLLGAVGGSRRALPAGHPQVGNHLMGLGTLYLLSDRPEEALAPLRESRDVLVEGLAPGHPMRTAAQYWLAEGLHAAGRCAEGLEVLEALDAELRARDEPGSLLVALTENLRGACLLETDGDAGEARSLLARSREVLARAPAEKASVRLALERDERWAHARAPEEPAGGGTAGAGEEPRKP